MTRCVLRKGWTNLPTYVLLHFISVQSFESRIHQGKYCSPNNLILMRIMPILLMFINVNFVLWVQKRTGSKESTSSGKQWQTCYISHPFTLPTDIIPKHIINELIFSLYYSSLQFKWYITGVRKLVGDGWFRNAIYK